MVSWESFKLVSSSVESQLNFGYFCLAAVVRRLCPLEGHCDIAGCPLAHDKSQVTCKYWEQNACHKEMTCPFFHGYLVQ